MSLQFEPRSSLEKHIDTFQKTYANYESITLNSANRMTIFLSQTLYDIKPFELNSVLDRVAVEHCRRGPALYLSLEVDNKQKEPEQPKSSKQGGNQNKNIGVNRGQGKNRTNANPKRNEESLKRVDLLEKQFSKLELNAKTSNVYVITEAHKETPEDFQHSDSDSYVTTDKVLTLGSGVPDQIYLD
ncbi:hypothetical protein O181_025006 [Austropuccinia psidii MF-1]|uniref:Uncharacterized protein n=1 Tax=Austropuccinia psidii MF-1 TaxID=1389203 RepID=A0A9Q3GZ53_9BASI|nr:hypothetical protein [Austropuccinia psidii MF-1]